MNQFKIPYDAICQSYYPIYHGPLTAAQAAASNPGGKPIEQQALTNAANTIGKPIFIIETGEHYENGFDANDPWYTPPSQALQRQFLLDLQAVEKGLPNNLGMGIEYWDPAGVTIPGASGIYTWNGLTLFDETSTLLPGVDALGGKLDPTLTYQFVNRSSGQPIGAQWRITGNNDGYFQIAGAAGAGMLLGGTAAEWNVVSAASGYFYFVDRASGRSSQCISRAGQTILAAPYWSSRGVRPLDSQVAMHHVRDSQTLRVSETIDLGSAHKGARIARSIARNGKCARPPHNRMNTLGAMRGGSVSNVRENQRKSK